jgi:hypothetical protein
MRAPIWICLAGLPLAVGCIARVPTSQIAGSTPEAADSCEASRARFASLPQAGVPVGAVSAFLDDGGRPEQLAPQLYERGWVTPGSALVIADLDADSDQDLAVGLIQSKQGEASEASGVVTVWLCEAGAYRPATVARQLPEHEPPALLEAADLTGDLVPEMVVVHARCGAHTCFARYDVLQLDGGVWVDRFDGPTDDLPTPEWRVHRDGLQGPAEIEVVAGGIGSVGAGPVRLHSRTWRWEEGRPGFVPSSEWVEPPRYRLHLIHDADDAFARGEMAVALERYARAVTDESLLDWPTPEAGKQALIGYAAFRRVLAFLALGDSVAAEAEYEAHLASADGAAAAFEPLARVLLQSVPEPGLAEGCAAVIEMARANPQEFLDPLSQGYANRTYMPADICPFD